MTILFLHFISGVRESGMRRRPLLVFFLLLSRLRRIPIVFRLLRVGWGHDWDRIHRDSGSSKAIHLCPRGRRDGILKEQSNFVARGKQRPPGHPLSTRIISGKTNLKTCRLLIRPSDGNYFSSPTTFLKVDEVVYFSSMKRPFLSVKRLVWEIVLHVVGQLDLLSLFMSHNWFHPRNWWHGITPLADRSQVTTHICFCVLGRPDGCSGLCGQRHWHPSQTSK
jgi:hypothetical protein